MTGSRSLLGHVGQDAPTGNIDRWALIIGVSSYAHATLNLQFAARDASRLSETLLEPTAGAFPPDHVLALIDENATLSNLTKALRTFLKKPAADDLVILFVACHGSRDRERPDNLYLLPHDVDPADISGTGLPMREVELALRETLHSRRVVVLVDACHSGGLGDSFADLRGVDDAAADLNAYLGALSASREGVSLMTSAMASESSIEGTEWGGGHGVFTYFLLEGLRGRADRPPYDGVVTVGELFDFVGQRVKEETQGRQHPHISAAADRSLVLSVTGSLSASQHLELARRLAESADLLGEQSCWRGAAAQYGEFLRFRRDPDAEASSIEHALALFRSGATASADQRLRSLSQDVPGVRLNLGLLQLSQGDPSARATLLEPTPIEPWTPALFSSPIPAWRRVALLVGLDVVDPKSYGGWDGRLKSPVAEVDALGQVLRSDFGFDEQIRLVNEEATAAAVQEAMNDLMRHSADCEAIVICLSGHGSLMPSADPGGDLVSTFAAFDAQITSHDVEGILGLSAAERTTLVVSAAHSGGFTSRALANGYEVLASCRQNQTDFESETFSYFMEGLLKSLTPDASGDLITTATRERVEKQWKSAQHPEFAIRGDAPLFVGGSDRRTSSGAPVLAPVLLGSATTTPARVLDQIARLAAQGDLPASAASTAFLESWRRGDYGSLARQSVVPPASTLAAACGVAALSARSSPPGTLGVALDRLRAYDVARDDAAIVTEIEALIDQAGATAGVMSRLRAVLIGTASFHDGAPGAETADAGVAAVRGVLVDKGARADHVTTLVGAEATESAIRASITAAGAERDAHAVLVYWCGAGTLDELRCFDGGALDQADVARLAPTATLVAEGIEAVAPRGRQPSNESGLRLVLLSPSARRGKRGRSMGTVSRTRAARASRPAPVGELTRALVDALARSDTPADIRVANLVASIPRTMIMSAGADVLLVDPVVARVDAVVRAVQDRQLNRTMTLVNALLDRRNGVDPEALLQLGLLRSRTGDVDGAIGALEASARQFVDDRPGEALARLHLGRVLLDSGRDRPRAVSECRAATERDPELVAAWFWLGRSIAELIERETTAQASAALRAYLARGAPIGRRSEVRELLASLAGKAAR